MSTMDEHVVCPAGAGAVRAPRWVFVGDSITDSSRRGDPEHLGYGYVRLIAERRASVCEPAVVVNRGVSGERTAEVLQRWEADCLQQDPDLLTLYVGVNDTGRMYWPVPQITSLEQFRENYTALLRSVRDRFGDALPVLVVTPFVTDVDPGRARFHQDLDPKVAVVRQLAEDFGCHVVDAEAEIGRALRRGLSANVLAEDGVHPTLLGHRILAEEWWRVASGLPEGFRALPSRDS